VNGQRQRADDSVEGREREKQAPRGKPEWHIESADDCSRAALGATLRGSVS